jgi:uncharacterized protein involved in response to NO
MDLPPAAARWRLRHLLEAPHRLAFVAGAAMLALSALWWAAVCLATSQGVNVVWQVPRIVAHGTFMTFGFMPLFFTGFLFTAGPKWLRRPAVPARVLVRPVALQAMGWIVFVSGCHVSTLASAVGIAMAALAWLAIVMRFARMVLRSSEPDRVHATLVAVAGVLGVLAMLGASMAIGGRAHAWALACVLAALWAFIGLVFATVSHRMLPFLSAAVPALEARRPRWLLWCLVTLCGLQGALSMSDALFASMAPPWRTARASFELFAGLGVTSLAVRWAVVQSLRIRLLAMLDAGLAWLGVSLLIAGFARLADDHYSPAGAPGLAATHAYTLGFLGSTMFAMVSRVSSGHGGRTVAADGFLWGLFWALQVVVLVRLAGAVLAASHPSSSSILVVGAAAGWAGVCLAWSLRYGRWYGQPRHDLRKLPQSRARVS